MDDYPLWVASKLGYFRMLGLEVELVPGPKDPDAMMLALAAGDSDIGFPPPSALVSAVDRGLPLVSVFQVFPTQVFTFAVPMQSPITRPAHLSGKVIAVGSLTWRRIIEPMLADAGVDLRAVGFVEGGPNWPLLLDRGRADAAVVWEGLRADWAAQGRRLRALGWERWSRLPSNSYVVRRDSLEDPVRRDLIIRFLRAVVMGLEFARQNPRAAAQVTYRSRPQLAKGLPPQRALDWMLQVAKGYGAAVRSGHGWGFHYPERWRRFTAAWSRLGYSKPLPETAVFTNHLVATVNDVNAARVTADGLGFTLDPDFRGLRLLASSAL